MALQLSPGVNTSEVDLTTVVPSVSTSAGAFVGSFNWGPVNERMLIDSEITLAKTFTAPDGDDFVSFFSAANFLAYGNNLTVVRAANTASNNAVANSLAPGIQIANADVYQYSFLTVDNNAYGSFAARYPGALGNSIQVQVFDSANTTLFNSWSLKNSFAGTPTTSDSVTAAGGANDQFHIAVVDAGGLFSGVKGTVLEVFPFVSKAIDAKDPLGNSNYYKNVVFHNSHFVQAMCSPDNANTHATWGQTSNTTFARIDAATFPLGVMTLTLTGGVDAAVTDADLITGWGLFTNKELIDVSLAFTGDADVTVQQWVIDNVATTRKDLVAFISPPSSNVINQAGFETVNIQNWLGALARSSSYVVADSGWKYQFDKYNNTYRWIPLNADIAGLCVNTDSVRDPWWSPAGYNRGAIKNAVKLAWNPNQTDRDVIYPMGVNPVISQQGQGIVLFGDKTLQAKPSAFDRINVRRLFIVLEKSIALAAKYSLFEFNDAFTQAQFVALVEPFLRNIKGRRGIYDYKVVCDATNNTPQVVDSNQFVGDIYVKPARSINFIQLNFVAVRTGVSFSEITG